MKLRPLLTLLLLLTTVVSKLNAQTYGQWNGSAGATFWSYSPGTVTPTTKLATTVAQEFIAPNFLVSPPTGDARVFVFGNATPGGSVTTESGKLTMVANHTGGAHKFAAYNINNVSSLTSLFFTLNVSSAATNGLIILGVGSSSGAIYTNISQLSGGDQPGLFTALQFSIGAAGVITPRFRGLIGTTTHPYSTLGGTAAFTRATDLPIEMYCNNSASSQKYTRATIEYTVPAGNFHVYVNGTPLTTGGSPNIPNSGELTAGKSINAFTFNGSDSSTPTNNSLSFSVSDIKMGNNDTVLPVTLTDFTAKKQGSRVALKWSTSSEVNNQYFELFRSANTTDNFQSIYKVTGKGTTGNAQNYAYTDFNPQSGNNYYQLKQVDQNGEVKGIWNNVVNIGFAVDALKAYVNNEKQLELSYTSLAKTNATIVLSDLNGRKITSRNVIFDAGKNSELLSLNYVASGIYIVTVTESSNHSSVKVLIQ